MPSLTPADRAQLVGPHGACPRCRQSSVRQYCRSCDVFFVECGCAAVGHVGHRTYRWVEGVIVADPDFDRWT
jgi:hypothetical protein